MMKGIGAALTLLGACAAPARPAVDAFADCSDCPEMVVAPAGAFVMGAPDDENGRFDEEGPTREVRVAAFALSRTPITRSQYAAFARATGRPNPPDCSSMTDAGEWRATPGLSWRNPGFEQGDDHPVVCVSWDDAHAYASWLSARTGRAYRLPSEAEFEYAARAGAATTFPWGAEPGDVCAHANGFDLAARREHPDWPGLDCDDGYPHTAPATSHPANVFGLYGMTGNVFQWTEDCFHDSYAGAPRDGAPWVTEHCATRVIRGGSWLNSARGLRAAMRDRDRPQDRYTNIGIRVARTP